MFSLRPVKAFTSRFVIILLTVYALGMSFISLYYAVPEFRGLFTDKTATNPPPPLPPFTKGKNQYDPISEDSLLSYSVKVEVISPLINRAAYELDPKLPPVKIFKSELSYKSLDTRNWIIYRDGNIIIPLYRDVSNILTPIEVMAVVMHEVCHESLGHNIYRSDYKRELKNEIAADECAVSTGVVGPEILITTLGKLDADEQEKAQRIQALRLTMK